MVYATCVAACHRDRRSAPASNSRNRAWENLYLHSLHSRLGSCELAIIYFDFDEHANSQNRSGNSSGPEASKKTKMASSLSSSGALFGGSTAQTKNLLEFRAGKMAMKGRTVHPDKRKGLIYVYQSDDTLMHFCWKDRQKGAVEDDLIIFPDDVEYKRVSQCTTGRVYLLKFKSNSRKMFFWMQDPKSDKDEENCQKLNDFLNNPPPSGSSHGGGSSLSSLPPELAGLSADSDLQNLLGSMNQQQLMQIISGMGGIRGMSSLIDASSSSSPLPDSSSASSRVHSSSGIRSLPLADVQLERQAAASAPPSQTPAPPSQTPALPLQASALSRQTPSQSSQAEPPPQLIRMEDLQNILSGMGAVDADVPKEVDLSQSIDAEMIIPILANPEVQRRLVPFLPDGEEIPKTEAELRQTVHSPQFRQALQSFSAALASCQLGPLMNQFGLNEDAVQAAVSGDVAAFARALQNASKKNDENQPMKTDEDERR